MISIRGVSDVGFPIFADTDADANFARPQMMKITQKIMQLLN